MAGQPLGRVPAGRGLPSRHAMAARDPGAERRGAACLVRIGRFFRSSWDKLDRRQFLRRSALLGRVPGPAARCLAPLRRVGGGLCRRGRRLSPSPSGEPDLLRLPSSATPTAASRSRSSTGWVAGDRRKPLQPMGTMTPHIPYSTPIAEAAVIEGALCSEGAGGHPEPLRPLPDREGPEAGRQARRKQMENDLPSSRRSRRSSTGGDLFGVARVGLPVELAAARPLALHELVAHGLAAESTRTPGRPSCARGH